MALPPALKKVRVVPWVPSKAAPTPTSPTEEISPAPTPPIWSEPQENVPSAFHWSLPPTGSQAESPAPKYLVDEAYSVEKRVDEAWPKDTGIVVVGARNPPAVISHP